MAKSSGMATKYLDMKWDVRTTPNGGAEIWTEAAAGEDGVMKGFLVASYGVEAVAAAVVAAHNKALHAVMHETMMRVTFVAQNDVKYVTDRLSPRQRGAVLLQAAQQVG